MLLSIKKWGNSQGIRFSKDILEPLDIHVDDEVKVEVVNDQIIITKAYPKKIDIEKLFADYKGTYKGEELDWGPPKGGEIW